MEEDGYPTTMVDRKSPVAEKCALFMVAPDNRRAKVAGATPNRHSPVFRTRDSLSALQPTGAEPRVHEPLWLQHQAIAGDFTAVVSLLPYACSPPWVGLAGMGRRMSLQGRLNRRFLGVIPAGLISASCLRSWFR